LVLPAITWDVHHGPDRPDDAVQHAGSDGAGVHEDRQGQRIEPGNGYFEARSEECRDSRSNHRRHGAGDPSGGSGHYGVDLRLAGSGAPYGSGDFQPGLSVVQAAVFLLASIFVLVNLVVDLLYTYLDPRVKLG